ncbi:MIP/aquaporin family protein [Aspergillus undulatus]|uniref:MIP/aquaporin family protein n=1 Tax=Aspergillus undulatus TaxID=1810928 RepID=UPI003CCCE25C
MADNGPTRPQATSGADRLRDEEQLHARSPNRRGGPERRSSGLSHGQEGSVPGQNPGLRRRSTAASRSRQSRSNRVPSLSSHTTLRSRTNGNFTLAGPDETPQLRTAHEPFVHPGYSDLNPEYEQPTNTKPVWSLAKPLPRVVRPGMVPTKEEILQNRVNEKPQLPAENLANVGADVDPNEIEAGRIEKTADPRKMAAGVDDARAQRENNFVNKLLTGETGSTRLSRQTSSRMRRPSFLEPLPSEHGDEPPDQTGHDLSDEPLHDIPEEHDDHSHPDDLTPSHLEHFDDAAYPEDLHPLVQDLVEDEVHNNHTVWSVIRTHHREALAESLAVFIQLTVGLAADLSVTLGGTTNPNTTAWAWGFAAMMAIYISGGVSGAHLNPTITCMLWFYRGFPKRKMPEYFAAQFIGAFVAALAVYGLYYSSISDYLSSATATSSNTLSSSTTNILNSFITSQRTTSIDPATAFFNEFLGTVVLTVTVLALGDDQNAPPGAGMNALVVGLIVYTLSITFSYQTGAALNPSRDFGPRLAMLALGYGGDLFLNPYWFYGPWAGSFCGAFIGAFLYDFFIFTGGESPVNYPWERTERAMRRKKMKWRRRLGLGTGEEKVVV